jgi:hypothetical protein
MVTIAAFVGLVLLYSLVSRQLEHTVITAPMAASSRLEPSPGLVQVRCLKPFGEPAVDLSQ